VCRSLKEDKNYIFFNFIFKKQKNCINFAQNILGKIMFAIVNIAGQQFKVKKDDELFVHRLEGNAGDKVEFSEILMMSDGGNITVGAQSKKVQAEIIDHLKGDKVIIFKKNRRKGFQKKNGHRQSLTKIKINTIA
jgi:large subunit ribosomal protein L21